HETHREWSRYAEPFAERGVWKAPYLIDSPDVDREMAEHQGAVNALDRGVGEILDALETAGELENTILVFTTDHGIDFPRAKGTLFDPGVEVFLFMAWAGGGWRAGERSDALVSHVDLYPTILEACGIGAPGGEVGRSMLPLVTGEGEWTRREAVYHEKIYHDNYDPIRALRTDRYRYILNFDAQTLYDVRIATAPRYTWFRFPIRKSEREELYDLEADPVEANNLAGDADHQDVRDRRLDGGHRRPAARGARAQPLPPSRQRRDEGARCARERCARGHVAPEAGGGPERRIRPRVRTASGRDLRARPRRPDDEPRRGDAPKVVPRPGFGVGGVAQALPEPVDREPFGDAPVDDGGQRVPILDRPLHRVLGPTRRARRDW
ncbi:MAG: sulfatase/phosphatase domain-containing protein, partial [Spirochaetota bacterium]